MFRPFSHFYTITKHRHGVIKYCFRVGIGWQGLFHDLSKYAPTEFIPGAKYYLGTKSPNEKERELFGYSKAWMHHKGRNRHHFEYWTDLNPKTKLYEPVKMPISYVKEMFCDRIVASKIYQGKNYQDSFPLEYFTRGNAKIKMHKETGDLIEKWLTLLATDGEKKALEIIKNQKEY